MWNLSEWSPTPARNLAAAVFTSIASARSSARPNDGLLT